MALVFFYSWCGGLLFHPGGDEESIGFVALWVLFDVCAVDEANTAS